MTLSRYILIVNSIQSIFDVHPATAIASSSFSEHGPEKATSGIIVDKDKDMFHSDDEKYPWLAIDLGFYYASDESSDSGFVYKVYFYQVIC